MNYAQLVTEHTRRSMGTFKRGKLMGRDELKKEIIKDLELLESMMTELEIRKELPNLIRHYKEME